MLFLKYSTPHEGGRMNKLIGASLIIIVLAALQGNVFAATLNCKFKDAQMKGVDSIQISEENLIINNEMEIPLEKSRVNCAHFGRQTRLDGSALGYQVILKSCSTEAQLEGHLIDSINEVSADVLCQQM
jgi:hypothetical protein